MQGIYTYIPETNYVPREYSVSAILLLLFMVHMSLVSVLNLLYFYISTFRSMCAVSNMAVFCSFIIIIIIMYYILVSFKYWCINSLKMAEFCRNMYVRVNKKLYCYVYYMCMCWFYKGAIHVLSWLSCSSLIYRLNYTGSLLNY